MQNSQQILNISNFILAILFTQTQSNIYKIKDSIEDTHASLVSELSLTNDKIQDMIDFNIKVINKEYIDFLIKNINEVNSITISDNKARPLTKMIADLKLRAEHLSDKKMSDDLIVASNNITTIISRDIKKSSELSPQIKSKTYDFISSIKNTALLLTNKCAEIKDDIQQCSDMYEACMFCIDYLKSEVGNTDYYAPITEEPRDKALTKIAAEYVKWRDKNVSIT